MSTPTRSRIRGEQPGCDGDLRREGRAGTIDVERAGILGANFVLHNDRRVRRDIIRRSGADHYQVDVFGFAPGTLERLFGGRERKIGCHPILRSIEAAVDAGAGGKLVDDMRPAERGKTRRQSGVGHGA